MQNMKGLISGSKSDQLKVFSGLKVRTAEIVVELVNRKPMEVARACYSHLTFDDLGNID